MEPGSSGDATSTLTSTTQYPPQHPEISQASRSEEMGGLKEPGANIIEPGSRSLQPRLPRQVWDRMISYMDEDTLFELGRTNRWFNTYAFKFYFAHRKGLTTYPNSCECCRPPEVSSGPESYPTLLTAVRCSLFITRIGHLSHSFCSGRGLQGLIQDAFDILCILRRTWIKSLTLRFKDVDSAIKAPEFDCEAFVGGYRITVHQWSNLFTTLLTTAINRGAHTIQVSGGQGLTDGDNFFNTPPPELALTTSPGGPVIGGFLLSRIHSLKAKATHQGSTYMESAWAPFLERSVYTNPLLPFSVGNYEVESRLWTITLDSAMLFSPAFLDYTISILHASAHTLSRMRMIHRLPSVELWGTFFSRLCLPRLEELEFALALNTIHNNIDGDALLDFLGRHPKIRYLNLQLDSAALQPPSKVLDRAMVPRTGLRSFTAHPIHIPWVLQLPRECVPMLQRVVVRGSDFLCRKLPTDSQPPFDPLLDALAREPRRNPQRRLALGMHLDVARESDIHWMQQCCMPGSGAHDALQQLSTIVCLHLSFSYKRLSLERMELLAQFIDAFPAVETVLFQGLQTDSSSVGWSFDRSDDREEIHQFFESWCPRLMMLKLGNHGPFNVITFAGRVPLERIVSDDLPHFYDL